MNEAEWMMAICQRLCESSAIQQVNFEISCRKRLPYRYEISSYKKSGEPHLFDPTSYEVDLLITEIDQKNECWTPRIAIEGKLGAVTTHDALTYSAKVATHVQVHPYLRYGILIGGIPSVPLRLFRHGANFDFMITWKNEQADQIAWTRFEQIIAEEIASSKRLQNLIESARSREKARYQVVRHRLVFEE